MGRGSLSPALSVSLLRRGSKKELPRGHFQQTRVYPYPLGAGFARPNPKFRERPPGLIQHVLTVLVFLSWVLLLPALHLRLGASDCAPGLAALAFCFLGPWTFAWICCPQPPQPVQKPGRSAQVFAAQGGTRRKMGAPDPENPLFLEFSVFRGGIETMVSEGTRPRGRGRSGDSDAVSRVRSPLRAPYKKKGKGKEDQDSPQGCSSENKLYFGASP